MAKQKEGNKTSNCNCPWIQTYPFMVKAALRGKVDESKLLIPTLHFRYFERALDWGDDRIISMRNSE